MKNQTIDCPIDKSRVVDDYFLEHRAQVIDIAAFLDRIDRATGDDSAGVGHDDFRVKALLKGLMVLLDGQGDRAKRALEVFSDPGEGLKELAGEKGACGAFKAVDGEGQ